MIKLFSVDWSTNTAGPSPLDNKRVEVFFKGCRKAMEGNPCKGCFNTPLWSDEADKTHDPIDMAAHINKYAPNKYITIGGGEPTDQLEDLIVLVKELKKYGFHIMMYSWQTLKSMLNNGRSDLYRELFNNIDILVDGEYKQDERCYDDENKGDGFLNSVGSGNQIVWDVKKLKGFASRDIYSLKLDENNDLLYFIKPGRENNIVVGE